MSTNSPQTGLNYRTPGANEEHLLLYADSSAARQAMMNRQRQFSSHLSEVSVLYVKLLLLMGTLVLAYTMFGPHI
jgi:hypothetical protein